MGNRGLSRYFDYFIVLVDLLALNIVIGISYYYESNSLIGFTQSAWMSLWIFSNVIWLIMGLRGTPLNLFNQRNPKWYKIFRFEGIRLTLLASSIILFQYLSWLPWTLNLTNAFLYFGLWIILSRIILSISVTFYRKKGYNYRNVYIIDSDHSIQSIQTTLEANLALGYRIIKSLYANNNTVTLMSIVEADMMNLEIDELLINSEAVENSLLQRILDICDKYYVKVRLVSDKGVAIQRKILPEIIDDLVFMEVSPFPLENPIFRLFKRGFDLIFSIFAIVLILSWLFPLIAIIIYLDSKGPILFKQSRTGMKGREFICYKFRTMIASDFLATQQAVKNDIRVTRVGRFLRSTSIDELPQFLNVLLGNMSVVGPRPHMLDHTKLFSEQVNNYFNRHAVKPGITGLAQIKGYRGEIKVADDLEGRIMYDKQYIENWTFFLDIKIILVTTLQMVTSRSKVY